MGHVNERVEMAGREKTLYSIYRKMREKHLSFAQVNDIFGFRIVVATLTDCYVAMGALHQLMKPMPMLAALLDKARAERIFGTKMRSFIKRADEAGTKNIVIQQFEIAEQIISANLVPIIEPEIDIHCPEKGKAEQLLKAAILEKVNQLPDGQVIMLKLTLPEQDNFYAEFVKHPKVLRVVALSGGYSREEANNRLRRNHGVVASFSRALVEGLTAQQSDAEFNAMLDKSIQCIFDASNS